jgi:hypothetical protein
VGYHAGLPDIGAQGSPGRLHGRRQARVVVATNAFGMGIDKPDVRLVVALRHAGEVSRPTIRRPAVRAATADRRSAFSCTPTGIASPTSSSSSRRIRPEEARSRKRSGSFAPGPMPTGRRPHLPASEIGRAVGRREGRPQGILGAADPGGAGAHCRQPDAAGEVGRRHAPGGVAGADREELDGKSRGEEAPVPPQASGSSRAEKSSTAGSASPRARSIGRRRARAAGN